jgi:hypothetical protein
MTREEEIKQASEIIKWTVMARYGFVKGAEWADAHPHWISIRDELPETGHVVMLAIVGYNEVEIGYYGTDKIFRDSESNKLEGVTHFMCFPKLPKGVKK